MLFTSGYHDYNFLSKYSKHEKKENEIKYWKPTWKFFVMTDGLYTYVLHIMLLFKKKKM